MAAKKCPKCGKTNPHFFTHCVECGAKLDVDRKKAEKTGTYLKIGLILGISLILAVFVALPAFQYSMTIGRNLSDAVSAEPPESIPVEHSLNQPVGNNNLQITINSARDGQNTYNSNKFFIISVYLKNVRDTGNVQISSSDFELIDSEGAHYFPYGIGSKVTYDLSPSQGTNAELTFIIPQTVTAKKILFTFQGTSATTSHHQVVTFVV
jgi:hypothetical protein